MARYSKAAYIEVGDVIRTLFDQCDRDVEPRGFARRSEVAKAFADMFERDNPGFRREPFLRAVGKSRVIA